MAIGFKTLIKLTTGDLDSEQISELFSSLGIEIELTKLLAEPESFVGIGRAASLPGAKLIGVSGRLKNGDKVSAVIVVNLASDEDSSSKKQRETYHESNGLVPAFAS